MNTSDVIEIVRTAWSTVPAPPDDDMKSMEWAWGKEAALAFTGVAPMAVDIRSSGFAAATPLLDLPPRAAAAYLGPFLVALLKGLEFKLRVGFFDDVLTRAHTITALTNRRFWATAIRKHLPQRAQEAAEKAAIHVADHRDAFGLDQIQVDALLNLAASRRPSDDESSGTV
jgi:hypothetical protein